MRYLLILLAIYVVKSSPCDERIQICHSCCLPELDNETCNPNYPNIIQNIPVPGQCHICLGECFQYCWSAYPEMPKSLCQINFGCYFEGGCNPLRLRFGKYSIEPHDDFRYWLVDDYIAIQNIHTNSTSLTSGCLFEFYEQSYQDCQYIKYSDGKTGRYRCSCENWLHQRDTIQFLCLIFVGVCAVLVVSFLENKFKKRVDC